MAENNIDITQEELDAFLAEHEKIKNYQTPSDRLDNVSKRIENVERSLSNRINSLRDTLSPESLEEFLRLNYQQISDIQTLIKNANDSASSAEAELHEVPADTAGLRKREQNVDNLINRAEQYAQQAQESLNAFDNVSPQESLNTFDNVPPQESLNALDNVPQTVNAQYAMLPEPEIVFKGTSKKPLDHIEDLTNDINKIEQAFVYLLTKKVENNFGSYKDVRDGFNNQIIESLFQIHTVEDKIEEAKKLTEAYLAGQSGLTRPEYEEQFTNYMKQANEQLVDVDASGAALTESVNQADKMAKKGIHPYSLRAKFLNNYFNDDFGNTLCSIDFGKYIFRSLNPEADMPQAAELKNEIINLLTKDSFTDEKLVGLIIDKTNNDPGTVSFDMVADMVDSDAYKKFGQNNAKDRREKNKFKKWIYKKSVLSKLDDEVLVTLHEESLKKVIDAIVPEEKKEDFLEKIDKQVESFQEFSNSVKELKDQDPDFQKKLEAIINGQPQSNVAGYGYTQNVQKLDGLYSLLYGEDAIAKKEQLYAAKGAKKPGDKEALFVGMVANENLVLKALTDKGIIEKGADGKMLQIAEQPANKGKKFNPVTDVITTLGMSVTGAGVFSALRAIGIGEFFAPFVAVANVGRVAWSTYKKEKAKASKNSDLKSSDVKKIARRVAGAMVLKSLPYLGTSLTYAVLGSKARAVSAVWVFVKTWYDDVNRTAAKQRNQSQNQTVEKGLKGLKNKAKVFGQNFKSINRKERWGAALHAAGKAGAMFAGGQLGAKYGAKIGAWGGAKIGEMFGDDSTIDVGDKLRNLGDKFKGIFNRQSESPAESPVVSDDTQFIYEDNRTYEDVQKNYHKRYQEYQDLCNNEELMDTYEKNRSYRSYRAVQDNYNLSYQNDMLRELSPESLAELDALNDKIELTDAARKTADVNNHRQYVDGVKQDWYTHAEQAKAVDLLEHAGVEDPMGVLRKLGSAARFEAAGECEGAGYQEALKNLCNGTLTDADVDAIQKALINIDQTGDLIRPNAGASADTSGIESATNENSSTSGAATEPSASQSQSQTQVETETKLSALNMKDVSVGNSESGKNNDVAVVPPHIDDVSIGNGEIVDLDDIDITYVPSNSLGNKIDEGTINTGYLPKDEAYNRGV